MPTRRDLCAPLRTLDRKCSPRMFGLHDPDQRDTHSAGADMLGGTLQSRPPTLQSWTRNTRSEFAEGGATSPTTLHSKELPSCSDVHSRWPASRIRAGKNRCVKDLEPLSVFFAEHNWSSF